jgi:acyl-coenzyme A thioesterase PaaI-like protein
MSCNLETIKYHCQQDRFATSNGMRLVELRPGFAKTSLQLEQRHLNSIGTLVPGHRLHQGRSVPAGMISPKEIWTQCTPA